MRILQDVLIQQQGTLFYDGVPFSGLIYQVEGQEVVGQRRLWNGEVVGNDNDWLSSAPLRILAQALVEVDEPDVEEGVIHYQGEPFTGLSLSFYEGKLYAEEIIIGGEKAGVSRRWHDNGILSFSEDVRNGEYLRWQPDGRLKEIDTEQFTISFDDEGGLNQLSLRSKVDLTDYLPSNLAASIFLVISGSVDVDFLSRIDMTPVEKLTLRNLNWGPEALDKLGTPLSIATKNTKGLDGHLASFCDQKGCSWRPQQY